jgi:hypothetical protein
MTLVVAAIDQAQGSVCIAADSKVTWLNDETRSRKIYTEPVVKVILLDDDLAVGYAGAGPEQLAETTVRLRGTPVDGVLNALATVAEASFVVVQREPARIWMVSAEGGAEERTAHGRAWAGDQHAFGEFQRRFDDFPASDVEFRVQSSMQGVVHLVQPRAVGGYVVMATAGASKPFRYRPLVSRLFPEGARPVQVTSVPRSPDGTTDLSLQTTFDEGPLTLRTMPGEHPTPGALGLYLENAGLGYVYAHDAPTVRAKVRATTTDTFVLAAMTDHGQHLTSPYDHPTSEVENDDH